MEAVKVPIDAKRSNLEIARFIQGCQVIVRLSGMNNNENKILGVQCQRSSSV